MKKIKLLIGVLLVIVAFSAPFATSSEPQGTWQKLWHPVWGWDCSGIPDGCFVATALPPGIPHGLPHGVPPDGF